MTGRRRGASFSFLLLLVFLLAPAAVAADIRIVAFGDSLTKGYNLPPTQAFPAQLERALRAKGYGVTVLNAGVSGNTTASGLARLDRILALDPEIVIVEFGANDVFAQFEPQESYVNLDRILTLLRQQNIRVLLTGSRVPSGLGPDYDAAFNAIFPALAKKHRVPLYPFFLEGVAKNPKLNLLDGVHPNAEGVAMIVEGILPHVLRLLDSEDN